jgi:hypothetical protein
VNGGIPPHPALSPCGEGILVVGVVVVCVGVHKSGGEGLGVEATKLAQAGLVWVADDYVVEGFDF